MLRALLLTTALAAICAAPLARAAFVDLGTLERGERVVPMIDLTETGFFEDQFRFAPTPDYRDSTRIFFQLFSEVPTNFKDQIASWQILGGFTSLDFRGGQTSVTYGTIPSFPFYDVFLRYTVTSAPASYEFRIRVTPLPAAGLGLATALGLAGLARMLVSRRCA